MYVARVYCYNKWSLNIFDRIWLKFGQKINVFHLVVIKQWNNYETQKII
jgi:hypothetical protein